MPNRQQKLARATRLLAKYYGLYTVRDLAGRIAMDTITSSESSTSVDSAGNPQAGTTYTVPQIGEAETMLIDTLINTSEGGTFTKDLVRQIDNAINNSASDGSTDDQSIRNRFGRLLQMHYAPDMNFVVAPSVPQAADAQSGDSGMPTTVLVSGQQTPVEDVTILQILGYGTGQTRGTTAINSTPNQPSKESPGLSIYLSNSSRVTLESQNVNPATIFLNGIPNIELQRATPFVNVEFFSPKPDPGNFAGQLSNLSLNKFLIGAVRPRAGSSLEIMTLGNTITGSEVSTQPGTGEHSGADYYSRSGMELFTSPQTLVNADEDGVDRSVRSNQVLDKFRPLMTLQELTLQTEPSRGLMSFKRGSMTFVLHDRSRLPEVSEFVRADLYGTNEITIEYGWSHPDGEMDNSNNAYGDLINGMRVKEKYMVTNSSFNFDPTGQVVIKLDIAMRGSSEFNTELMSSNSEDFGNIMREVERLQTIVGQLRQRAFPTGDAAASVEIRGSQILDAAVDITSHPILTSDLREALSEFERAQRGSISPSVRDLLNTLTELYGGSVQARRRQGAAALSSRTDGQQTVIQRLTRSVQESIRQKINDLRNQTDPFLPTDSASDNGAIRYVGPTPHATSEERQAQRDYTAIYDANIGTNFACSLGKLLLHFIGEPLANTGKYDEVQMIFYPFNEWAGRASGLNIANFVVDVDYFADELFRYRLEHLSRSSIMPLRQFMDFIADILIDDPMARSYGLHDQSGAGFYRVQYDGEGNSTVRRAVPVETNPANFQARLEAALQGVTPDSSFRMPQIGIYIEAIPERPGTEDGSDVTATNGKTILRLHVYDQVNTSYTTLGQLLQASRTAQLQTIGGLPNLRTGNQNVIDNRSEFAAATLDAARSICLIETIPSNFGAQSRQQSDEGAASGTDVIYRIVGSPQKLKDFIMSNTPYIIYGAAGTTVKNAQLSSMQNSTLATVNLVRSFRRENLVAPNGEDAGGLPMQIIPTQLSAECIGNPLLNYMQSFFVDFQTGTTADNIYCVTGIEHKFVSGDFTTQVRFTPQDAWGSYRSLVSTVGAAIDVLRDIDEEHTTASES
jgi:hypothetical protein